MRNNSEPHDIFMTIRIYNKMIKLQPERSKRENTDVYFQFEGNEYLVMRCSELGI